MDKLNKKKPSSSEAPSLSSNRFQSLLQSFSSKVSGVVGQEYFEAVVFTISEELAMDFVFIGELIEGKTKSIRTRAVYAKGQLVDNFDYGLAATPCANVMEKNVCIYPMGVQTAFPEDLLLIEMGIEGYMGAPLIDSRGHPMGIMVVLHRNLIENQNSVAACFDIVAGRTSAELERMKKEEQLKEALVVAKRANQTKSMFLATMSHELRTPLNAICGFSEVLIGQLFGPLGSKKYQEYAEDIHTSGQHLLSLVNDILDLSAIESGQQKLHLTILSLGAVVAESCSLVKESANSKNIEISVTSEGTLPLLKSDKRAIKQILLNIFSNAIKFTPEGGSVALALKFDDGIHKIILEDTGIGIPDELISSLGTPFINVDENAYISQGSTGLGLAIVKSLVEKLKGSLEIKSVVDKGTTVTIILPPI